MVHTVRKSYTCTVHNHIDIYVIHEDGDVPYVRHLFFQAHLINWTLRLFWQKFFFATGFTTYGRNFELTTIPSVSLSEYDLEMIQYNPIQNLQSKNRADSEMSSMLKFGGCSLPRPVYPAAVQWEGSIKITTIPRGIEAKSGRAVGNAFAVIENGARVPSLAFIVQVVIFEIHRSPMGLGMCHGVPHVCTHSKKQ